MVIFHSKVLVYQRLNLHFPMVFLWFSQLTKCNTWSFDDMTPILYPSQKTTPFYFQTPGLDTPR